MPQDRTDDAALPDGVAPLEPDDPRELGGHRILGRIGRGGMGMVYLATMRSGRRLAIKVVRPEYAQDEEFRSRFAREISAALKVRGPYLAALVDADAESATPWMATEYVPGPTLAHRVTKDGAFPPEDVRALVGHVAEALYAVHRAGLVHRDIKPANVLLGPDGPCLIDLGIAQASDATALTIEGTPLGTPVFMAPEQARGLDVSPATDVWALGGVAYYAATGRRPFGQGRPDAMYYRVVHEDPQLEQCPADLLPFIQACLAKDPAARPTVREILDASPHLPGSSAQPEPACPPAPTPPPRQRSVADLPAPAEPDSDSPVSEADTFVRRPDIAAAPLPAPPLAPGPTAQAAAAPAMFRRRPALLLATVAGGVVVLAVAAAGVTALLQDDDPGDDATMTATGSIDPCLVGRWEQTAMSDIWDQPELGEPVDVTGWDGRVLEFHEDGTEIARYDDATALRGEHSSLGEITQTWSGTASFQVTTVDGALHVAEADYSEVTVRDEVAGATQESRPLSVAGSDVEYTCDKTTMTQHGGDYEATFERLG